MYVDLCRRCLLRLSGLLRFFFVLVVMPRTNGGVDEASEEEDKADKQYDTGHATVKSMSFTHTGCLTHKRILEVYPKMGDGGIKAQERDGVN